MLQIVRRVLRESFAGLLRGCVRKRAEVVLLTDSAALASQLRFYGPVIQEALNTNMLQRIESVKIRIIQPIKPETCRPTARNIPSLETITTLRGCSEYIADTALQISLNRLADTLERTITS
ncbi:MAG: hypothetical protein ACRERU_17020 [Methylococcales bacterium]